MTNVGVITKIIKSHRDCLPTEEYKSHVVIYKSKDYKSYFIMTNIAIYKIFEDRLKNKTIINFRMTNEEMEEILTNEKYIISKNDSETSFVTFKKYPDDKYKYENDRFSFDMLLGKINEEQKST